MKRRRNGGDKKTEGRNAEEIDELRIEEKET
jgi:hypothetical protein